MAQVYSERLDQLDRTRREAKAASLKFTNTQFFIYLMSTGVIDWFPTSHPITLATDSEGTQATPDPDAELLERWELRGRWRQATHHE